jgi:predicted MFS family arabinose efflux permease
MRTTYDETLAGAAWGAVSSMALCVAVLIASEFMPVSLLTPIAGDLGLTEGQAGQPISISGLFAVVTSLFIAGLTRDIDRKIVLSSFSLLLIVSGTIVTFAPNYAVLMLGRALLGVAIGGFWSMSTAIVMRLLPEDAVPQGLSMLNAGNAVAATISAPLGSFLGDYIGWRGASFSIVPLALLALVWQWMSMPSLPPRRRTGRGNVFRLLWRPQVALGMTSILLLFMGQFALFTYLRPFLEFVSG